MTDLMEASKIANMGIGSNSAGDEIIRNCDSNSPSIPHTPERKQIHVEVIGSDVCTANGRTVRSQTPVLDMCRQLLAAGMDPDTAMVVYRRGIVALRVRTIGEAARLQINSKGTGFVVRSGVRTAPYSARTEAGGYDRRSRLKGSLRGTSRECRGVLEKLTLQARSWGMK